MSKSQPSASSDLHLLESFWKESIDRWVLPNGLTLIVKRDSSAALASVQVWVKTGSIHEGDLLGAGLSHYLEHMLFKGTEKRAGREISATVQAHGGYINAYTTFDRTVYYIDLPSEHVGVAVDVLADAVFRSTLPAEEVEREKNVILREIDMGRDDPDQRLGETLFEAAFKVHPYRLPIIGHREIFSGVGRDELYSYYKGRYVPNNTVVVVVGDVEPEAVRRLVDSHLGVLPRGRLAPVVIPEEPRALASRSDHRYEGVELTRAGLAWQIPGLAHEDAPGLELLAMVLGAGDSSVLWRAVREKARLVHSIDATSWNPGTAGLFYVSFTCDAGRRERATQCIERTLAEVTRRGFSPAQIRKAIRQLMVGEINTRKTMSGQASRLGAAEVVVGDLWFTRTYFDRLRKLSSADLVRLARTYLIPQTQTAVSISPLAQAPRAPSVETVRLRSPGFEEIRLPNGARLLLQEDSRIPNLHFRMAFMGGPSLEAPNRRGASALLATLLTKDTRRRTAAEVAQRIEEVGGSFGSFAGNNALGLSLEVLPTDSLRAIDLLGDAVLAPAFQPQTFDIERGAQLADLQQDADDVVTYGRKLLRRRFFGDHPLAIDSHGDPAGLQALSPADVRKLHQQVVVGGNAVLAVAGAFSRKELLPHLKKFLAKLPRKSPPPLPVPFDGPAANGNSVDLQPREQAVVFQGFPGPGAIDADMYVADVADELFSGMASRLFERVREEKGLAYFVRSSRVVGLRGGLFYFYAGTAPVHADEVLAEIDAEIARVAAGQIEPAELLRCQVRLKAAKRQSMQTNASRAMQAALNALYGQPVNDWLDFDRRIESVTIDDLSRFARTYLRAEKRVQVVVRPA
ncbi:MAG: insulinase family protein [Opitutaceae bacterium]|nr:insulinase family protein [Opitutaceae bacterium]